MYDTVVFVETSLDHREASAIFPEANYQLSVKKGDILKAIKDRYKRIVIIDGNFSWVPSVWHKEILNALDYGITVIGAASMGALRAAELDLFGMIGHGYVYEMYKHKKIDGDDEVAISYSKYNSIQTIPLINIRVTLERMNISNKEEIIELIRTIFYADRTWEKIADHLPAPLFNLIKTNYIDIKREDAKSLLLFLNNQSTNLSIPYSNGQREREFTLFEKKAIESMLSLPSTSHTQIEFEVEDSRVESIMKFLSVPQNKSNEAHFKYLISLIDQQQYEITEIELIYQIELFREERNLLRKEEFVNWLREKNLYNSNLHQLFSDYVKLAKHKTVSYDYNAYFI